MHKAHSLQAGAAAPPLHATITAMLHRQRSRYRTVAVPRRRILAHLPAWIAGLACCAAAGIGAVALLRLPALRVTDIALQGGTEQLRHEVEDAIRAELAGAWLGVAPRESAILVSARRLARRLRERFPEAAELTVAKEFPARLRVSLRERTPWGVYCEEAAATASPPCAFLDANGVAYEPFSDARGHLFHRISASAPVRAGSQVSAAILRYFDASDAALAAIGADLVALAIASSSPGDYRLATAEGWSLLVAADRPPQAWRPLLETVMHREIGERRSELEYVDLRFGNKVFYRYEN